MAKVETRPNAFKEQVCQALKEGLKTAGIRSAQVRSEPIPHTKMHRFFVFAKGFENLRPSERQDLVWRAVNREIPRDDQLRISMVLTMTPEEFEGD